MPLPLAVSERMDRRPSAGDALRDTCPLSIRPETARLTATLSIAVTWLICVAVIPAFSPSTAMTRHCHTDRPNSRSYRSAILPDTVLDSTDRR